MLPFSVTTVMSFVHSTTVDSSIDADSLLKTSVTLVDLMMTSENSYSDKGETLFHAFGFFLSLGSCDQMYRNFPTTMTFQYSLSYKHFMLTRSA